MGNRLDVSLRASDVFKLKNAQKEAVENGLNADGDQDHCRNDETQAFRIGDYAKASSFPFQHCGCEEAYPDRDDEQTCDDSAFEGE